MQLGFSVTFDILKICSICSLFLASFFTALFSNNGIFCFYWVNNNISYICILALGFQRASLMYHNLPSNVIIPLHIVCKNVKQYTSFSILVLCAIILQLKSTHIIYLNTFFVFALSTHLSFKHSKHWEIYIYSKQLPVSAFFTHFYRYKFPSQSFYFSLELYLTFILV